MGSLRTPPFTFASLGLIAATSLGAALAGCGSEANMSSPSGSGGAGTTAGVGGLGSGGGECSPETELCDGLDNDCDGQVDEDCPCIEGETQSCYSGDPSLEGIGACQAGTQTCDLNGAWGACEGEGLPDVETCDGIDNDCDTLIDEDLGSTTCGLGICQVTVDACLNGVPNPCIPGPPNPAGETCEGSDDNCDGQIDEGCMCTNGDTQNCYSGSASTQGVGQCHDGTQTCANGAWGGCMGDLTPSSETCDGVDNDCDGQTDENNPGGGGMCASGQQGVCGPGTLQCQNGGLVCVQNLQPSTEQCNGLDDDCDGMTDENNPGGGGICSTGLPGVCLVGTFTCQSGSLACVQNQQPSTEQCNGLDDDCDGMTDENNPGGGGNCNTGQFGICSGGTQQCLMGSLSCVASSTPVPEVCNGLDDDCDNAVDEGNPGGGNSCSTSMPGVCSAGTSYCLNGGISCVANTTASAEQCNGLDDDCDGMTDEGNPGGGNSCGTTMPGVCALGHTACQNGGINCIANTMASAEQCNGLDDDCDGQTDEGNPGGGGNCSTQLPGVCAAGTLQCLNASLTCMGNTGPSSEVCGDNLDNDCDGQTDEGCNVCNNVASSAATAVNPGGGSSAPYNPPNMVDGIGEVCSNGYAWVSNSTSSPGWATLTWTTPQTVGSIFIDSEHGTAPACSATGRNIASAQVQYRNSSNVWVTVGTISGQENYMFTFPSPVTTTGLRLNNVLSGPGNGNTMIYEWYVFPGTGCPTPTPN